MELLALYKAIKKPPRSDERDGELFCGTLSDATLLLNSTTTTYHDQTLTDDLSPYSDYDIAIIIATRGNGSFRVSVSNCNIIADFVTAYDAQHVFVISGITSNSILSGSGYGTAGYTRVIIGLS